MLPLRLRRVAGHGGRANDALFQPAAARSASTPRDNQTLVFFGGDVQDYPEVMQTHRDNRHYIRWNLESTARALAQSFPTKHILVVRPSRVEFKSFSCYDNFVPSNNAGVPEHTGMHNAARHLEQLLEGVSERLKAMPTSELLTAVAVSLPEQIDIEDLHNASMNVPCATESNGAGQGTSAEPAEQAHEPDPDPLWWRDRGLERSRLTLVGFSKGCVVLNQLVYEFHYAKTLTPGDHHMTRFTERIDAMYWLDGGHSGGKNTWLSARSLLETLARLDKNIYVHVSPYQVKDGARPWIGKEEKAFSSLLRKLGAKIARYLHAGGAPHSLQTHFDVLDNFKRVQDAGPPPPYEDDEDD